MAGKKKASTNKAISPEAREQQLTNLAVDLAEKQLMDGTASNGVITHFLKLATQRERIEKEILEEQKKKLVAQTKSISEEQEAVSLGREAVEAMTKYSGNKNRKRE